MSSLEETRKPRPATEWAAERLFRPLAQLLVDPLAKQKVRPEGVVLFHTALGLVIAWQVGQGQRLSPALLLQLRTVLDSLDGQLARATAQTSETGRYLDTEMDLLVNFALNTSIAGRAGVPLTLLQSLILTVDYLWEHDYRLSRGEVFREGPALRDDHPLVLAVLKALYAAYFTPQEKLLGAVFTRRLQARSPEPTCKQRQAYTSLQVTTISANLGLSSQHLLLGACLLLGKAHWYTRSLPLQALLLVGAQLWREGQVQPSSSG